MATVKSLKADVLGISPLSELKMSPFKLFTEANLSNINSVDNTKLHCYTLPAMQHHKR